jgi:hypothetical protein
VVIGCSVPTKSWPNESKDLVWTAMIAAAKTPDYSSSDPRKRWVIVNNDVVINEQLGRILVHRKLTRSLQLPRQKEQTDNREWYFVIQLIPEGEPTVTFDAQGIQLVPARIVDEANRYFLLIDEVLHPIQ